MDSVRRKMSLYNAYWKSRLLACEISEEEVIEAVQNHWAYGDPTAATYHLGTKWAMDANEDGWRIEKSQQRVYDIHAEFKGKQGETCHVCWQCPECDEWFSDDVDRDKNPPMLSSCGQSRKHSDAKTVLV